MYAGKLVFAQLTDLIHPEQFRRCVRRYAGDYKVKTFSCWNQFLCMAFGRLTFRESLRDVETCLRSRARQLYQLGHHRRTSRLYLAPFPQSTGMRPSPGSNVKTPMAVGLYPSTTGTFSVWPALKAQSLFFPSRLRVFASLR